MRPYHSEWKKLCSVLINERTRLLKNKVDIDKYKVLIPKDLFAKAKAYRDYHPFFPKRNIFDGDPMDKLIGFDLEPNDNIDECKIELKKEGGV